MSSLSTSSVAIVGAGIGGLVLAIALQKRGIDAEVFEQTSELTEIGAAVALSANSTRELERLGVLDNIAKASTEPYELIWRDGRSGQRLASHPVLKDNAYRRRFGAPYFGIHRASLQKVLSTAHGKNCLNLGHRLTKLDEDAKGVTLTFANGKLHHAQIVVGADGVRSLVRRHVSNGDPGTVYSGTSAFRGIVPKSALRSLPDPLSIQFWIGPGAHLLHYAIGGAAEDVNFFAVVEGPEVWPSQDRWIVPASDGEALSNFRGWHPAVTEMISAGWVEKRWGLFVVQQPARWHRGRVVIIGDAAHGMLPHQGQGANSTIEDAVILAELLHRHGFDHLSDILKRFETIRKARTRAIQRSSWATNRMLHLHEGDRETIRRETAMASFPEQFSWIHDYDCEAAVASHG